MSAILTSIRFAFGVLWVLLVASSTHIGVGIPCGHRALSDPIRSAAGFNSGGLPHLLATAGSDGLEVLLVAGLILFDLALTAF
jgi:hypothetical protein